MVGSRRASPYALNAAQHLAGQLVSAGIVIVSGLARGVDSASHAAALEAGGTTIAILGTGIDIVYPRSNRRLFRMIEERGLILVVTEVVCRMVTCQNPSTLFVDCNDTYFQDNATCTHEADCLKVGP